MTTNKAGKVKKGTIGYLAPDVLVRAIINPSPEIQYLIKKKNVVTSAFGFYEMMACLTEKEIKENATTIAEIFKDVPITEFKEIYGKFITEKKSRIKHLRKIALSEVEGGQIA